MKPNGRPPSDEDLIDRMRRGDADAFDAWYDRYVDGLYGFVFYRVGRDPEIAADAVQDTLMHALSRLDDFDSQRGPMIAWLCTLSRNVIRDALSSRDHAPLASLWDSLDASLERVYEDLDTRRLAPDFIEARETRELVGMALVNLPEKYRDALRSKYLEGKSFKQIASESGASLETVRGLVRRAREAFRHTFAALAGARPYLDDLGVR